MHVHFSLLFKVKHIGTLQSNSKYMLCYFVPHNAVLMWQFVTNLLHDVASSKTHEWRKWEHKTDRTRARKHKQTVTHFQSIVQCVSTLESLEFFTFWCLTHKTHWFNSHNANMYSKHLEKMEKHLMMRPCVWPLCSVTHKKCKFCILVLS